MFPASDERACILIADDEQEIRNVLYELLSGEYDCQLVSSAEAALARLRAMRFDVIVSDINMEGMSGLEMIPHVAEIAPDAVVVMVSGAQTVESAIEALRAGAFDYVTKPFDLRHVEAAVRRALEHKRLREAKRRYENYLEELVAERTAELDRTLATLEDSYRMTLKALAAALETRDRETHGHSERVVSFSLRLGRELKLTGEELRSLEFGALLHDIGKIGVPDAILHKPAQLCAEEWVNMRRHPVHGQQILRGIEFLEGAARVVGQHHEKWDGTGYPAGLRGEEIDLNARIFAVADAFDAITSDRVYRAGRSYEVAVAELEEFAGRQFDPAVVAAFRRIPRAEWDELRAESFRKWQERQDREAAKLPAGAETQQQPLLVALAR
ncbi:MAG TPA: HD domain-containing phosphohydrolase [Pyrinomonadaceae bacterium]|jgi:response regulator RpfG family c-di-GMP phosphodiesterase|nr:HD domain-containing phosphohydrolase [Pyrinomonadaceae bacterium]